MSAVRKYQVPTDQVAAGGVSIGGGWFPFKGAVLELPADGSQHMLLPRDFVELTPEAPGEAQAAATPSAAKKRDGGDRGETAAPSVA